MKVKGVILAGGNSSRLFPATKCFTKHFLTIYDNKNNIKNGFKNSLNVCSLSLISNILKIRTPKKR